MKKKREKSLKPAVSKYVFIIVMLGITQLLFWPMHIYTRVDSVLIAFQEVDYLGSGREFIGFANFQRFFTEMFAEGALISISVKNSLKMYFINLIISVPLYITFSYFLYKKIWGHKIIRAIVMLPQILSTFIIALLFKKFLDAALPSIATQLFGMEEFPSLLNDSRYAFGTSLFYMIWLSFSTSLIVYPNAFNGIDTSIIESAKLDGVHTMFQELWYILLPLIYPTFVTFIVCGFAAIFSEAGPLYEFYMYNAPSSVYNLGYLFSVKTYFASATGYPVLAAGGLTLTLIVAPLTWLLKWVMEKYGPTTEM